MPTLTIDLDRVRLSPAAKLALANIIGRQQHKPRALPAGHSEALDECLGKPERKPGTLKHFRG
jgi:hypothetical protein